MLYEVITSSKFYYLPSLQIKKIINVPGAIKKRKVRISLKKKFQHYLGQLEGHEKGVITSYSIHYTKLYDTCKAKGFKPHGFKCYVTR